MYFPTHCWPFLGIAWNLWCWVRHTKVKVSFSPQNFKKLYIFFGLLNQKWIERSHFLRILCTFHFSCFWIFGYLLFVVRWPLAEKIDFFFRSKNGLTAKMSKFGYSPFQRISHKQLGLFLRCCEFVRFENVKLNYNDRPYNADLGFQSIDKKFHLFVKHLKPLKAAFSDSTIIQFYASIGYRQSQFTDPLQLLNHLRNELLPVCDSARRYEFSILFYSQEASATAILDAILQMPPINFSTNVAFNFYQPYGGILPQLLPVDAISVWLNRSNDMVMKCNRQQKKLLELKVSFRNRIQNVQQLFEHFKKVHFAYSLIKSKGVKNQPITNYKFASSDSVLKLQKISN